MSIEYRDSTARRALATLAIRRGGLASLEEACRETMSERWRIAMLPERLLSALLIRSYLHRWSAWNAASLKRDVLVDWDQAFREKRGWDLVPAENGPIPRNLSEIYDFVLRNSIVEMNEVSVFT